MFRGSLGPTWEQVSEARASRDELVSGLPVKPSLHGAPWFLVLWGSERAWGWTVQTKRAPIFLGAQEGRKSSEGLAGGKLQVCSITATQNLTANTGMRSIRKPMLLKTAGAPGLEVSQAVIGSPEKASLGVSCWIYKLDIVMITLEDLF